MNLKISQKQEKQQNTICDKYFVQFAFPFTWAD